MVLMEGVLCYSRKYTEMGNKSRSESASKVGDAGLTTASASMMLLFQIASFRPLKHWRGLRMLGRLSELIPQVQRLLLLLVQRTVPYYPLMQSSVK